MEVPRLDHALNSPTSPCEEVIKNLSLEAIQLCDRDVVFEELTSKQTRKG
ncbi:phytanoyl-CoA 2-hydroxylase interacting protein like [Homo sapiens]|uniref:Isoform 3 of Phytanoyl-CoA hydroxylase-interacting protein-like n=1 Tax=Homo sapiens TaxID=9606 RepID=Q96FC7-3|nr:phytanoyl-CoA 2-hydroxylase interacting protein like [Homo sapiens]KAI4076056.1 phytanoyl-CoA 2-hydroxylase interacting protein like [Homo sapiens]CAH18267.1 hypothetical protein [Homo sapiens]